MTNKIAVRMNGYPFAFFNTEQEANRFVEIFKVEQAIKLSQLDYIDAQDIVNSWSGHEVVWT